LFLRIYVLHVAQETQPQPHCDAPSDNVYTGRLNAIEAFVYGLGLLNSWTTNLCVVLTL